jgi:hypothetical protein
MIFGTGRFGDAAVPFMERLKGAQTVVVVVIGFALVLSAFFAQRRRAEADHRESDARQARKVVALTCVHEAASRLWLNRDLHQALDEVLAGAIGLLGADMGNIQV